MLLFFNMLKCVHSVLPDQSITDVVLWRAALSAVSKKTVFRSDSRLKHEELILVWNITRDKGPTGANNNFDSLEYL